MVKFSYHAQEQMKRLSPQERSELARVLESSEEFKQSPQIDVSDRFVSRFGADKRVVWQKSAGGDIFVLTVVSKQ